MNNSAEQSAKIAKKSGKPVNNTYKMDAWEKIMCRCVCVPLYFCCRDSSPIILYFQSLIIKSSAFDSVC